MSGPVVFEFVIPTPRQAVPLLQDRRCELSTIARQCFPLSFCLCGFQFSLWCLPKQRTTPTTVQRILSMTRNFSPGTSRRSTDAVCSRTRVSPPFPSPSPFHSRCNPNGAENNPSPGIILKNQDHHLLVFDGGIAKFRFQYQGRSVQVLDLSLWPVCSSRCF